MMTNARRRRIGTACVVFLVSVATTGSTLAQRGGGPGKGGGGSSVSHKTRQARPISLGVSGGNATDIANGYCCSGTLGALVVDGAGQQFILSNAHVFAHDTAAPNTAELGDPINQAGLVDTACVADPGDNVATLSSLSSLNPGFLSPVDAAVAAVIPGGVKTDGTILEIGTISSTPVGASLSQRVKKSGRTTGLTTSRVEGLNATISVGYSSECGGPSFSTTFQEQIIVTNRGQKFIAGGDSGSLMVEDAQTNPRAVGLLYAGSSTIAVANPITDVLDHFGVNLVGQPGADAAAAPSGPLAQATARAIAAQQRHRARLIGVPGAVGHAVGLEGNAIVIKVYVESITDRARRAVPNQADGVPVVLEATGPIVAIGSMGKCGPAK